MACTITGDETPDELREALGHHALSPGRAAGPDWTTRHVDPLLDALAVPVPA